MIPDIRDKGKKSASKRERERHKCKTTNKILVSSTKVKNYYEMPFINLN